MQVITAIVLLAVLVGCSAGPAAKKKLNLSGIVFSEPDPAVGKALSNRPENSTIPPWAYGSCYTRRAKVGRNSLTDESRLWVNGKVYYTLSKGFTKAQRKSITDSIKDIETNTCIKFFRRTTQTDYINITGNEPGCFSELGRSGGAQQLNLQFDGCLDEIGTGVHELLHALGTFHEHERFDRDEYVTIHLENVDPTKLNNFEKVSETEATTFGLDYDYTSLMHYTSYSFSINDEKTITANLPDAPAEFSQDDGMTALDIEKLNALYSCE